MLCFISIPSLGVKIHIWGPYFETPLVNLNKIFYLQKAQFTIAFCFLKYYTIYVHVYVYIYIYIYTHTHTHIHTEQVFKTAISGVKY
jgi:hypothetical protein